MTAAEDAEEIIGLLQTEDEITHCGNPVAWHVITDDLYVCMEHMDWFFSYELEPFAGEEHCAKVMFEHLLPDD